MAGDMTAVFYVPLVFHDYLNGRGGDLVFVCCHVDSPGEAAILGRRRFLMKEGSLNGEVGDRAGQLGEGGGEGGG